ncbi:MAG: AAA family ATPase [Halioglobus sp.]|nr:AAA family ATPase [Halioglobus sp.]
MYEVFYNFQAEPFRLSPDHKFCYEHKGYARARAYMAYAFMRAEGFVMITGRPGTGKTTLIGELVENLARDSVSTANLVCTQLQADDLLKTVAYNFGVSAERADKAELLERLNRLLHRWHRDGRRALLIVDEAQDLSTSAMEELRLLTNIQLDGQPLLQIFLLGQPELRELILSPGMEQVHQRIVAACHLEGLKEDEVEAYVLHRLKKVGWKGDPAISKAVFPLLHKFSEGIPRRINLICSRLFLHCGVEQRHEMVPADLEVVIRELQAENLAAGKGMSRDEFTIFEDTGWVECPVEPDEPGASGQAAATEISRDEVEAPDETDWVEDMEIEEAAAAGISWDEVEAPDETDWVEGEETEEAAAAGISWDEVEAPAETDWVEEKELEGAAASGQMGREVHLRAVATEPRGAADHDPPAAAGEVVSKKKSRKAPAIATGPGATPDPGATAAVPRGESAGAKKQSVADSLADEPTGSSTARPGLRSSPRSERARSRQPATPSEVRPSTVVAGTTAPGDSQRGASRPRRGVYSWAILLLLLFLLFGGAAAYLFAPELLRKVAGPAAPEIAERYTDIRDVPAPPGDTDRAPRTKGQSTPADTATAPAVDRSADKDGRLSPAENVAAVEQEAGPTAARDGPAGGDPDSPDGAAPDQHAGAPQSPQQTLARTPEDTEQPPEERKRAI